MSCAVDVERFREIIDEIEQLVSEARNIARLHLASKMPCYDAYVFQQITEHINKANPYNQDLNDVANDLESRIEDDEDDENCDEDDEDCD